MLFLLRATKLASALALAVVLSALSACQAENSGVKNPPSTPKETTQAAKPKKRVRASGLLNNENLDSLLRSYAAQNPERTIRLHTNHGTITLRLYRDVVLHSANFLMLAKDGYFDGTVFYRVVPGLVIQGGDTDDHEKGRWKRQLGSYTLPPEVSNKYVHRKGALAMSRRYENNPDKRSSSWDFYIVHGQPLSTTELAQVPEAHRETYRQWGGAPHLDGEHTVFGEVIEGLEVVDRISAVRRDGGDWPINNVSIKMEVLR